MTREEAVRLPPEPSTKSVAALATVLAALELLTSDDRKRVLHAASAFYRVEQTR